MHVVHAPEPSATVRVLSTTLPVDVFLGSSCNFLPADPHEARGAWRARCECMLWDTPVLCSLRCCLPSFSQPVDRCSGFRMKSQTLRAFCFNQTFVACSASSRRDGARTCPLLRSVVDKRRHQRAAANSITLRHIWVRDAETKCQVAECHRLILFFERCTFELSFAQQCNQRCTMQFGTLDRMKLLKPSVSNKENEACRPNADTKHWYTRLSIAINQASFSHTHPSGWCRTS